MPDIRTTVTELVTGLGTLGFDTVDDALAARPAQMASVSPEQWLQLDAARRGGVLDEQFEASFLNGRAMLEAADGLRGRVPEVVEWKGGQKNPGDDSLPVDLRIDHVYLISCKYDSRMLHNNAPARVFDNALRRAERVANFNWYSEVADEAYSALYTAAVAHFGLEAMPTSPTDMTSAQRTSLKELLKPKTWPVELAGGYAALCTTVAEQSAARWRKAAPTTQAQEEMLWRILRMGPAPYYVLGNSAHGPMRLRIATPWDWRQTFVFRSLSLTPMTGGQPMVAWEATVRERHSGVDRTVGGFVEVRWSHGRFNNPPEAKVHLTTPHAEVPGYFPLV